MACAIEYFIIVYMMALTTCLLSLLFGFYFPVMATTQIVKENLQSINNDGKALSKAKTNGKHISDQFKQLINYQSILKQLSDWTYSIPQIWSTYLDCDYF